MEWFLPVLCYQIAFARLGTRSCVLVAHNPWLGFLICNNRERAGVVVMVPPPTEFLCKLTEPVRAPIRGKRPEQFIFLLGQSSRPSARDLGGPGRLRSALCTDTVVQALLGLLLPGSRQQIKIKGAGAAGRAKGVSAGSLTRSAGNACQPSRVAPAWAWRWVSDSRWCPLHPRARGWGSPNPHSGSRGASAPVPRSRVARR